MKAHSFAVSGTRKTATVVSIFIIWLYYILTFSVHDVVYSFMKNACF